MVQPRNYVYEHESFAEKLINQNNFGLCADILPLLNDTDLPLWCGKILFYAKNIDDKLDELFSKIIELPDKWYSPKKNLESVLKELIYFKESVRNIEIDVEEFIHAVSMIDAYLRSELSIPVNIVLNQVNATYKNTYDLVIYKLKSIISSRIVLTNIVLSVIAVVISIFYKKNT